MLYSKQFNKLKIQEKVLSSMCESAIRRINCTVIANWSAELENKRKQDCMIAHRNYEDLKYSLKTLNENVESTDRIKNLEVEFFRQHLIDIESKISKLKMLIKHELNILEKSEKCLDQEINNNILSCKHNLMITTPLPKSTTNIQKFYHAKNEHTARFQNFLYRTGGHFGGWGEEEHHIFMKSWQHCHLQNLKLLIQDHDQFEKCLINKVHKALPDLSTEEIISHKNWLIQYDYLKESQMKEIVSWKALRELNKYGKKMSDKNSYDNNFKKVTDKSKQNMSTQITKREIKDWQTTKHEMNKAEDELKAETYMVRKAFEYGKEKQTNDRDREMIAKWATAKKSEIDLQRLEKETALLKARKKRSVEANRKIQQFRLRDNLLVSERTTYIKSINEMKKGMNQIKPGKKIADGNRQVSRCGKYKEPTEQWCRRITKCVMTTNNTPAIPFSGIETIQKLCADMERTYDPIILQLRLKGWPESSNRKVCEMCARLHNSFEKYCSLLAYGVKFVSIL